MDTEIQKEKPALIDMIQKGSFDAQKADVLLCDAGDINAPVCYIEKSDTRFTTYLQEAVDCNCIEAVRFLLEHGADPSWNIENEQMECCPLWDLQYVEEAEYATEEEIKCRYEIAKLFFQHGANPNVVQEGESLYVFVRFKVYNFIGEEPNWDYLCDFYKLLILYGGCTNGKKFVFSQPIDYSKVDEYDIEFEMCEDGHHMMGFLYDPNGENIGRV